MVSIALSRAIVVTLRTVHFFIVDLKVRPIILFLITGGYRVVNHPETPTIVVLSCGHALVSRRRQLTHDLLLVNFELEMLEPDRERRHHLRLLQDGKNVIVSQV